MPRIAIASMFRNSTSYIDRYIAQVSDLTGHLCGLGYDIHFILAEGDSSDDTWKMLNARFDFLMGQIYNVSKKSKLTLLQINHGGPDFPSYVDNTMRWINISKVCNGILEAVEPDDDYLIYVESDLIWDKDTMCALLAHVQDGDADAIAPIVIHQPTGLCYDIWGHRKNGRKFQAHKPYHPDVGTEITTIDSADSCIVMRGEVARICRYTPPDLAMVGFGYDINAKGFRLCVNPVLTLTHP